MKKILVPLLIAITIINSSVCLANDTVQEYQLKAAFLYNFMLFTEWPQDANAEFKDSILIGILGKDPFGDSFNIFEDKQVNGRRISTKRFTGKESIELLKQCDILFICPNLEGKVDIILEVLNDSPVLTVSEIAGFIESGGMINFITEENKVKFEINISSAERAKITFRSKLLRLATRVIRNN